MIPSTKYLHEEQRRVPSHWASFEGTCVWDVRGSSAFVCGHWCAYEHVCVPILCWTSVSIDSSSVAHFIQLSALVFF